VSSASEAGRLAEIALETDDMQARVAAVEGRQPLRRPVAASVVDEDELV